MPKKYTRETFINKATAIHGNRYLYDLVDYVNNCTKVKIICKVHGVMEQTPQNHLQGSNCFECSGAKKHTLISFIDKALLIHGNKYSYDNLKFVDNNTYVYITCPVHGDFKQKPKTHLAGCGCPYCATIQRGITGTKSNEIFIKQANEVHNGKYDYSKCIYTKAHLKVNVICPEHGEFEQVAYTHLQEHGCPKCAVLNRGSGYSRKDWLKYCVKFNALPRVYIIRCFNDTENFIKIGITGKSVQLRFNSKLLLPYEYEIIKEIKGSALFVYDKEKELHKLYKEFKYIPNLNFGGYTECFNISILSTLS